ncbi:MAG: hypothetical protein MJ252_25540 [archaeon]|nr:hypothetical protein [archaeon]
MDVEFTSYFNRPTFTQQINSPIELLRGEYSGSNREINAFKISSAEARLKNDLIEYTTKRITTNEFEVQISKYTVHDDCLYLNAAFKGYFEVKIIFPLDYPFSAPTVVFISGNRFNLFDMEDHMILSSLEAGKWSPVLCLNSIIYDIELSLINLKTTNFLQENGFKKKKFYQFVEESKDLITEPNVFDIIQRLQRIDLGGK